jgi:hypothetical protein
VSGLGLIAAGNVNRSLILAGPLLALWHVNLLDPTALHPYLYLQNMDVALQPGAGALIAAQDVNTTAGPLLRADQSALTLNGGLLFGMDSPSAALTASAAGVPLFHFYYGHVNTTDDPAAWPTAPTSGAPLIGIRQDGTLSLAGPLLVSDQTLFFSWDGILGLGDDLGEPPILPPTSGHLVQTGPDDPLIQLNGGVAKVFQSGLVGLTQGATMSLTGGLLRVANGAVLDLNGPVLGISGGAKVTSSTAYPLIDLAGRDTALDVNGRGTDAVLQMGPMSQAIVGVMNQPQVPNEILPDLKTTGTGGLFRLDAAVVNATASVVAALNSALEVNGNAGTGAFNFNRSTVTLGSPTQAGFRLDNSVLKVNNGPLLSVTGGTAMTVNGDFAHLTNGAKVFVQNGPLVSVSGAGSVLNVTGALVNFGSAGNQVIINNAIAPTAFPQSNGVTIPVYTATSGTVNIGANAIVNPAGNTFSVTGSAIQATSGGKVGINAAP